MKISADYIVEKTAFWVVIAIYVYVLVTWWQGAAMYLVGYWAHKYVSRKKNLPDLPATTSKGQDV